MLKNTRRASTALALATACAAVAIAVTGARGQGAFPDRVSSFTPGLLGGDTTTPFGMDQFPANVLGPPNGSADGLTPTDSATDLLTLGVGGSITLEFSSRPIVDGPGADFTVFENPVAYSGHPGWAFVEAATVSVSDDGTSWSTFPFHFTPPSPASPGLIPPELYVTSRYQGLAGVHPVFSSPTNGISPFNPAVSGGDSFDLADLGLARARFVRIRDCGTTGPTQTVDPEGHVVTDPGDYLYGLDTTGFDLDAVAAIHAAPAPNAARREEWELYE